MILRNMSTKSLPIEKLQKTAKTYQKNRSNIAPLLNHTASSCARLEPNGQHAIVMM